MCSQQHVQKDVRTSCLCQAVPLSSGPALPRLYFPPISLFCDNYHLTLNFYQINSFRFNYEWDHKVKRKYSTQQKRTLPITTETQENLTNFLEKHWKIGYHPCFGEGVYCCDKVSWPKATCGWKKKVYFHLKSIAYSTTESRAGSWGRGWYGITEEQCLLPWWLEAAQPDFYAYGLMCPGVRSPAVGWMVL